MVTLTDLLFGPAAAIDGPTPQRADAGTALPGLGFAASLAAARTEAGLPARPADRGLAPATAGSGTPDLISEAVADAGGDPATGSPIHDESPIGSAALVDTLPRALQSPLGAAIAMVSREGTGHGRPGGNGLPLPSSDGGKTLPDLPSVRQTHAVFEPGAASLPPAAASAVAASAAAGFGAVPAGPGTVPGAVAASAYLAGQPGTAALPPVAAGAPAAAPGLPDGTGSGRNAGASSAVVMPATMAKSGVGAVDAGAVVAEAAATARETMAAARAGLAGQGGAASAPAPQQAAPGGGKGTIQTGASVVAHAGSTGSGGHPASAAAAEPAAGTPPGRPGTGVDGGTGAGERFQGQPPVAGQADGPDNPILRREPGAAETGRPIQQGAVAQALRAPSTDALQAAAADAGDQTRSAGRLDVVAAGVVDRRLIADAAGQRRGADPASPAGEEPERTTAAIAESGDPATRPQTARPVLPVIAGRDLAAVAERIEMLMHRRGGLANVSMKLSELGDVEISVRMEARQAHVQFVVQDAAAREALEAQLPRLRALLGEGGLNLGDVGTSLKDGAEGQAQTRGGDGRSGEGPRPGSGPGRTAGAASAALTAAEDDAGRRPAGDGHRLLDAFV